jgi:hypothetical protein
MGSKRHELLEGLRIATPCDVPWEGMIGGYAVRYCGKCRRNVYNVAGMSGDEALAVIERTEGRLCLRLSRRPDGTLVTGDCLARLRRARRRGWIAFAAVLPLALATQLVYMAMGVRTLASLFRRPLVPAVVLPAPKPRAEDQPIAIRPFRHVTATAGAPPPAQLDYIRAELRSDRGGGKHRR